MFERDTFDDARDRARDLQHERNFYSSKLDDAKTEIEALQRQLAAWKDASQCGHPNPCTLGPLCPYCEIGRLRAQLADCRAQNERLREDAVYIYNSGYNAGHHDTVEGQYTLVLPVDMRIYQDDVVAEILAEIGYDAARQEEG